MIPQFDNIESFKGELEMAKWEDQIRVPWTPSPIPIPNAKVPKQENFGGHEYAAADEQKSMALINGIPTPLTYEEAQKLDAKVQAEINKATNPKDAVGIRKVPFSVIPQGVLMELGVAMLEGARKYGRHNYREAGVRASVYYDAVCARHMPLWWDFGQDIDPDSGLSHITKALASLTVLRDGMQMGNWVDDRPPPLPIELYYELQKAVAGIMDKYPNAVPAIVNTKKK